MDSELPFSNDWTFRDGSLNFYCRSASFSYLCFLFSVFDVLVLRMFLVNNCCRR